MTLTPLDVFNNYSTNRSGFITAMGNDPNAGAMWDNFKSMSTKTTTSSTIENAGSYAGETVKTISGLQNIRADATTLSPTELLQAGDVGDYVSNVINALTKQGSMWDKVFNTIDAAVFAPILSATKQLTFYTEKEIDLRNKINSQLGMAGDMTIDFRNNIEDASVKMVDIGYGFDDVADTLISITENTGTMGMLGADVLERSRFTIRAAIGDLNKIPGFIQNFSDIGIGAESSFKQIEKSFKGSMELGLIGRRVVSDVNTHLSKINEYGFKNGVEGLTRMVQKSIEFKVNMDKVFTLASNLFDPDKAIDLAANLQSIGGAIGDFNNPLKMMYDATNNVEGIQDALIGAASSLSTYNREQGRFEVTSINLRKAKAMADQFGMTLEELTKISIKSSERQSAATSLMSRGLSLDDKEKEFLTNISRMEGGKMVIDVSSISKEFGGAQQIALDELTDTHVETLKKYQSQFKEMDIKDIAREQFTTTQNIALNVSALVAIARLRVGRETSKLGRTLDDVFGKDLDSALREQKDKFMGKSSDVEVQRNFGPTDINLKPARTEQKPSEVDNRGAYIDKKNVGESNGMMASTNVNLTLKADVPFDRVTNALVNNTDFAYNLMSIVNTPGSYTQMG
jgi:hypothetical protein